MTRNPNRMIEAVTKLMSTFKVCTSVLVTYAQGASSISGIAATPNRTPYETIDGGVVITIEVHDFIIAVADMQSLTPKSGDTITDANGRKFIVSMPDKMNVYENFQGVAYKIHTKAVT